MLNSPPSPLYVAPANFFFTSSSFPSSISPSVLASGSEGRANPERRQSEPRVEAFRENESEIGHFPTVFECKDSAE